MIAKGKYKFDGGKHLAEAARIFEGMPALTSEWSRGSLGFNDETDTDDDAQVVPHADHIDDESSCDSVSVSSEIACAVRLV